MRSIIAVVAFALLSAGCATYSWYNPRVPPEIAQRDQAECREQASRLVNWELMDDRPFWGFGWNRGPFVPTTSGLAMEQDVFDRCMRYKGYALVENPKASGADRR
jgi:hypothetical protein